GCDGALVVGATIWPTTPAKGTQGIFAWVGGDGVSLSLALSPGGIVASLTTRAGITQVNTGQAVLERAWYDIWLAVDLKEGTLKVGQQPLEPHPGFDDAGTACAKDIGKAAIGIGRALFAALPAGAAIEPPEAHFNGKLERPTLWSGRDIAAALARQRVDVPKGPISGLIACWDFSVGIPTLNLVDVGPSGF